MEYILQNFYVFFFWKKKWKVHLGTRRPETKECESVGACVTGTAVSIIFISSFLVNFLTHVCLPGT